MGQKENFILEKARKILYSQMMSDIPLEQLGLRLWHGQVSSMAEPHRHHEIELNFVWAGTIHYLFAGRKVELPPKQLMLFWAALPHRLTHSAPETTMTWLTVPLATWLRLKLPESLTKPMLHGLPLLDPNPHNHDQDLLHSWLEDQAQQGEEQQRIFELEFEARIRRFALGFKQPQPSNSTGETSKAALLAEYIAQHYLKPIKIPDIAKAIGLHPNYASELFQATFAMTMLEYLTQQRLAHAQRLLMTTNRPILEVAFEAGFGSASRFYTVFEAACGVTPSNYRRRLRQP